MERIHAPDWIVPGEFGKHCIKCKRFLNRRLFGLHPGARDGRYASCRSCERERRRAKRENREPDYIATAAATYDLEELS